MVSARYKYEQSERAQAKTVTFRLPQRLLAALPNPDNSGPLYERHALFVWMLVREDNGAEYHERTMQKISAVFPSKGVDVKNALIDANIVEDKRPDPDDTRNYPRAYSYRINPDLLKGPNVQVTCSSVAAVNGYDRVKKLWPTTCRDFD